MKQKLALRLGTVICYVNFKFIGLASITIYSYLTKLKMGLGTSVIPLHHNRCLKEGSLNKWGLEKSREY